MQNKKETVKKLMELKISIDKIEQITELTKEEIEKIIK